MPSPFPPPTPNARIAALVEQRETLEKKRANLAQFQGLCWIPFWVPMMIDVINPTPVVPGREIYVLWFRIGSFIFSLVSWLALRLKMSQLKKRIAALDAQIAPTNATPKPPIAAPF